MLPPVFGTAAMVYSNLSTALVAFVFTFLIWCQNCTIMGSRFRGIPKEDFRLINKLLRITLAVALLSFGTAVFAGTVTGTVPVPSAAVPITNGGFETGDFSGWTQFGDTSFNGVCDISTCPGGFAPFEGAFAGFFGPVGDTGGIYQDIGTVPGQIYAISFYLALPMDGPPNFFDVQFGNAGFSLTDFPVEFPWVL